MLKKFIEQDLKSWFKISAALWIVWMIWGANRDISNDPTAKALVDIGAVVTKYYIWFYLFPKLVMKIFRMFFGAVRKIVIS